MESKDTRAQSRRAWPWGTMLLVAAIAVAIGWGGHYLAASTASAQQGGGRFGAQGGPNASGSSSSRGASSGRGARGGRGGALPMPVGVATAATGDIDIYLHGLGTVTPLRDVTLTAQVSGQLQGVAFKEGQRVHRGDLLAQIDPRTYEAAVNQALGALTRDQAQLANARIDLARFQTLFKEDSIARQQLDAQQALVHQYEGTIQADSGAVAAAKVNLAYTKIVAPLDGRVGLRQVDPGNVVQNGTAIVVITQLQPIDALFTIPEDSLPRVQKKLHASQALPVDAFDRANKVKLASGTLASLDNQIDTSTGTVKAKAEFANEDEGLFPNQFVNVKVLLDVLHGAIVIPSSALQRGSNGMFVYVVGDDHTVSVRPVQTGPSEGERVAVTDGLQAGERVVTDGADRLREGSKVTLPAEDGRASASAASDASASGVSSASDAGSSGAHHRHGQWNGQHRPGGWGSRQRDGGSAAGSGGSDGG